MHRHVHAEILRLHATGMKAKAIAKRVGISVTNVRKMMAARATASRVT